MPATSAGMTAETPRRRRAGLAELALLAASLAIGLALAEFAIRHLPLGDAMGWSMVPPVADRAARAAAAPRGTTRIVALGDSMTEWRDNTGDAYVRVAERMLPGVEMINLAQAGSGIEQYLENFLRFGASESTCGNCF